MSIHSGFFDSVNGDRRYNALDFGMVFDGVIADGIFTSVGDKFEVRRNTTGRFIRVGTGKAWLNHVYIYSDSEISFQIDATGNNMYRVDTVVIEVDKTSSVRSCSIQVIKGSERTSMESATQTDAMPVIKKEGEQGCNQYALANVFVRPGVTSFTDADIQNLRGNGTSGIPYSIGLVEQLDASQWLDRWEATFNSEVSRARGIIDQTIDRGNGAFQGLISDIRDLSPDAAVSLLFKIWDIMGINPSIDIVLTMDGNYVNVTPNRNIKENEPICVKLIDNNSQTLYLGLAIKDFYTNQLNIPTFFSNPSFDLALGVALKTGTWREWTITDDVLDPPVTSFRDVSGAIQTLRDLQVEVKDLIELRPDITMTWTAGSNYVTYEYNITTEIGRYISVLSIETTRGTKRFYGGPSTTSESAGTSQRKYLSTTNSDKERYFISKVIYEGLMGVFEFDMPDINNLTKQCVSSDVNFKNHNLRISTIESDMRRFRRGRLDAVDILEYNGSWSTESSQIASVDEGGFTISGGMCSYYLRFKTPPSVTASISSGTHMLFRIPPEYFKYMMPIEGWHIPNTADGSSTKTEPKIWLHGNNGIFYIYPKTNTPYAAGAYYYVSGAYALSDESWNDFCNSSLGAY